MVIGTHRILTEKVLFKDLGLMIIDEEQRFGVEHKDELKKLKTNVDILAMSATPIPRTLEMAVTGIREMSTLQTPPEDRHPILSYVGARNDKQIAAAIRRELLREGQVFFVHNRVQSIQRVAAQLAELVPEARIAVAHGQMGENALEQVVDDFWERRFDVLVCTTIVETGLDISNANTIIIDRADKYGLSQLHQLRGRVGRARERAYAYFLYDEQKPLSETAADRLETIAVNNDLGSGMQVALKDLELRGAGNLLGAEQAGHIAGVGFDLYLRMIGEAVVGLPRRRRRGPGRAAARAARPGAHPRVLHRQRAAAPRGVPEAVGGGIRHREGRRDRPRARRAARPLRRAAGGGGGTRRRRAAAPPRRAGGARRRRRDGAEPARSRPRTCPTRCACGCSASIPRAKLLSGGEAVVVPLPHGRAASASRRRRADRVGRPAARAAVAGASRRSREPRRAADER